MRKNVQKKFKTQRKTKYKKRKKEKNGTKNYLRSRSDSESYNMTAHEATYAHPRAGRRLSHRNREVSGRRREARDEER